MFKRLTTDVVSRGALVLLVGHVLVCLRRDLLRVGVLEVTLCGVKLRWEV